MVMVDRDINITPIDTLHHVQGLSNLSNSVERRKEKKEEKRKDHHEVQETGGIDDKLEEELENEEKEVMADENMDHIDFRA
jgi:hypothetical protein